MSAESRALEFIERLERVAWEKDNPPKKGERWDSLTINRTCRVMCDPVEGYVLARYKGAMPFLTHVNCWHDKFKKKP